MLLEEQLPEQTALRTYRSANLNIEKSEKEEDIMEWVRLEPPIPPKKLSTQRKLHANK